MTETRPHGDPIERLLKGAAKWVTIHPDGRSVVDADRPMALLPGSFNPVHDGHIKLAAAAAEFLGTPVAYELSVTNVDKPQLEYEDVSRRVAQFRGAGTVILTRAETFRKKAEIFPGCGFAIGWDTATRFDRTALLRRFGNRHADGVGRNVGIGLPVCGGRPN